MQKILTGIVYDLSDGVYQSQNPAGTPEARPAAK